MPISGTKSRNPPFPPKPEIEKSSRYIFQLPGFEPKSTNENGNQLDYIKVDNSKVRNMSSNFSEKAIPTMTIRESKDSDSKKCKAKTVKGLNCKNDHLEGDLYCRVHSASFEHKKCQGLTREGKSCNAPAEKGSNFCRPDHDPNFLTSSTEGFRKSNLRRSVSYEVKRVTNNKNVYTDEPLPKNMVGTHLEHYVQLNVARDIYDFVTKEAKSSEAEIAKENLKTSFNQVFNLGFTDETTNQSKSRAVEEFCEDLRFREVNSDGLPHYLRKHISGKVLRADIRLIKQRIVTSYEDLKEFSISNFNGNPLLDESMDHLDYIFEKMKIEK